MAWENLTEFATKNHTKNCCHHHEEQQSNFSQIYSQAMSLKYSLLNWIFPLKTLKAYKLSDALVPMNRNTCHDIKKSLSYCYEKKGRNSVFKWTLSWWDLYSRQFINF